MADETAMPNAMQAHLGLLSEPGSMSPVGYPTPSPPMPSIRHPGEISASMVQEARAQAMYTMQGGPTALGDYAAQYRQNMSAVDARRIADPFYAEMVARMSGGAPFTSSMMPSATQFTSPSLGIFRPFPQAPAPIIPPVPPLPLIRHPFVPTPPASRFQTPMEYGYNYGELTADQFTSAANAAPGVLGRLGVDLGAGAFGGAAGAAIGAFIAGPTGARVGSALGSLGATALAEKTGFGAVAEHMLDRVNPARQMTYRGAQLQGMSRDWVVGGGALAPSGVGLSRTASLHAGRLIEDLAYDGSFRDETGRQFSVQDVTRIARTAGRAGLLDFAQTPEAVRDEVRFVAKQLRVIMQVANEPDVKEAVRQLSQMRSLGLTVPEATSATMNARMYARMAGTTIRSLTETAGLPAAMLYQEMGLSGGLGLQMGQGMYGLAKQAIASGAYSVQDIAMLGGAQGIAQRNSESALATLRMPLLAASMSRLSTSGTAFNLDPGNVERLLRGKIGIEHMARLGVGNLDSAVARGGLGAMGTFLMQQDELQDALGRALGPAGTRMLTMRSALEAQRTLGFDRSPGGLFMAARAVGLDAAQSKQIVREANSPEFFRNLRQQIDVQIRELRGVADEEFERDRGGIFSRTARRPGLRDLAYGFDRMGASVRGGLRRFNQFFGEWGEDSELPSGQTYFRVPEELVAGDRLHRSIRAHRADDEAIARRMGRPDRSREYGGVFTDYGHNQVWSDIRNTVLGGDWQARRALREMQGGARNAFASLEPFGRVLSAVSGGPTFSTGDQIRQELLDFERGASFLHAADTTTTTQHRSALSKVARNFGSSNIVYDLAGAISRRADSGTSVLFRNGQLNYSAVKEAFGDLQGKYSAADLNRLRAMSETDLAEALGPSLTDFASASGRERLRPRANEMGHFGAHRNSVGRALEQLDLATKGLFAGDKDDKLRELTKRLAAEDSDVVTYAALEEAVRTGEPGAQEKLIEYMKTLPEGRRAEVRVRAGALLQGKGGVNDMQGEGGLRALAKVGTNLIRKTGGDVRRMGGAVKGVLAQAREGLGAFEVSQGMGLLLKDQSDVLRHFEHTGDTGGVLSELSGRLDSEGRIRGVDDDTARLVKAWKNASSEEAKSRIAGELEDKAAGFATGTRIAGTTRAGMAEKALTDRKGDLGGIERELAESFPKATDDLRDAASMLREAAIRLGGQFPTQLSVRTGEY
jgi:hypothetical protein